jgi:arylsulfatase A-like enzyme
MRILVLALRGVHLGYLGCYGNSWIRTPHLDTLASEGVVFDHHYSDCPSPAGAWNAWRTGRYDFPVPQSKTASGLQDSPDLLSILRGSEIPAILISESDTASEGGAEKWHDRISFTADEAKSNFSRVMVKKVLQADRNLKSHNDALVWVETNFLAPPWLVEESSDDYFSDAGDGDSFARPTEPLENPTIGWVDRSDDLMFARLQRTYATVVSQLDDGLGQLLEELRRRERGSPMMLIVTADRGFPLGEHGLVGDFRPWLHDELVHIPLLIRMPSGTAAGSRIRALTQPADLMPTLLEAFGLDIPEIHGSSLLPLIRGEQERIREFACSGLRIGNALEWSLRSPDWAFLSPIFPEENDPSRDPQLYVKPDDRWEVNNVLQHHSDLAENLEKTLSAFIHSPTKEAASQPT